MDNGVGFIRRIDGITAGKSGRHHAGAEASIAIRIYHADSAAYPAPFRSNLKLFCPDDVITSKARLGRCHLRLLVVQQLYGKLYQYLFHIDFKPVTFHFKSDTFVLN